MAIMLPEPLAKIFGAVTGMSWPEANEDELREAWHLYQQFADDIPQLTDYIVELVNICLARFQGEAADAFVASMRDLIGQDGGADYLKQAQQQAQQLAGIAQDTANQVEYAKWMIIAQLVMLAAQIAFAIAWAPFTFGASLTSLAALYALVREAIMEIFVWLLKSIAMHTIIGVTGGLLMNTIIQGIQFAEGNRTSWDGSSLLQAIEFGAISGVLSGPMDLIGGGLGDALGGLIGKGAADALGDALGNEFGDALKSGIDDTIDNALKDGIDKGIDDTLKDGIDGGIEDALKNGIEDGADQTIDKFATEGGEDAFDSAPDKTALDDVADEDTVFDDAASEDTAVEDSASEDTAFDDSASEDTAVEDEVPAPSEISTSSNAAKLGGEAGGTQAGKWLDDAASRSFAKDIGKVFGQVRNKIDQGFTKTGAGTLAEHFENQLADVFTEHLGDLLGKDAAKELGHDFGSAFVDQWGRKGADHTALMDTLHSLLDDTGLEKGGVSVLAESLPLLADQMNHEGNLLFRLGHALVDQVRGGVDNMLTQGFYDLIFDDSHTFSVSWSAFLGGMAMGALGFLGHTLASPLADRWSSYVQNARSYPMGPEDSPYLPVAHPLTLLSLMSNLSGFAAPFPVPRIGTHLPEPVEQVKPAEDWANFFGVHKIFYPDGGKLRLVPTETGSDDRSWLQSLFGLGGKKSIPLSSAGIDSKTFDFDAAPVPPKPVRTQTQDESEGGGGGQGEQIHVDEQIQVPVQVPEHHQLPQEPVTHHRPPEPDPNVTTTPSGHGHTYVNAPSHARTTAGDGRTQSWEQKQRDLQDSYDKRLSDGGKGEKPDPNGLEPQDAQRFGDAFASWSARRPKDADGAFVDAVWQRARTMAATQLAAGGDHEAVFDALDKTIHVAALRESAVLVGLQRFEQVADRWGGPREAPPFAEDVIVRTRTHMEAVFRGRVESAVEGLFPAARKETGPTEDLAANDVQAKALDTLNELSTGLVQDLDLRAKFETAVNEAESEFASLAAGDWREELSPADAALLAHTGVRDDRAVLSPDSVEVINRALRQRIQSDFENAYGSTDSTDPVRRAERSAELFEEGRQARLDALRHDLAVQAGRESVIARVVDRVQAAADTWGKEGPGGGLPKDFPDLSAGSASGRRDPERYLRPVGSAVARAVDDLLSAYVSDLTEGRSGRPWNEVFDEATDTAKLHGLFTLEAGREAAGYAAFREAQTAASDYHGDVLGKDSIDRIEQGFSRRVTAAYNAAFSSAGDMHDPEKLRQWTQARAELSADLDAHLAFEEEVMPALHAAAEGFDALSDEHRGLDLDSDRIAALKREYGDEWFDAYKEHWAPANLDGGHWRSHEASHEDTFASHLDEAGHEAKDEGAPPVDERRLVGYTGRADHAEPDRVRGMFEAVRSAHKSGARFLGEAKTGVLPHGSHAEAVSRFPADDRFFSLALHTDEQGRPLWEGGPVEPEELAAVFAKLYHEGLWDGVKPLQLPACRFGSGREKSYAAVMLKKLGTLLPSVKVEAYVPEGELLFVNKVSGPFAGDEEAPGHIVVAKAAGFDQNGFPRVVPGGHWLRMSVDAGGSSASRDVTIEELGAYLPADGSLPVRSAQTPPEYTPWDGPSSDLRPGTAGAVKFGETSTKEEVPEDPVQSGPSKLVFDALTIRRTAPPPVPAHRVNAPPPDHLVLDRPPNRADADGWGPEVTVPEDNYCTLSAVIITDPPAVHDVLYHSARPYSAREISALQWLQDPARVRNEVRGPGRQASANLVVVRDMLRDHLVNVFLGDKRIADLPPELQDSMGHGDENARPAVPDPVSVRELRDAMNHWARTWSGDIGELYLDTLGHVLHRQIGVRNLDAPVDFGGIEYVGPHGAPPLHVYRRRSPMHINASGPRAVEELDGKTELEPEPKADVPTQHQHQQQQQQHQQQPQHQVEPKPEPKAEPKVEAKVEPKVGPKPPAAPPDRLGVHGQLSYSDLVRGFLETDENHVVDALGEQLAPILSKSGLKNVGKDLGKLGLSSLTAKLTHLGHGEKGLINLKSGPLKGKLGYRVVLSDAKTLGEVTKVESENGFEHYVASTTSADRMWQYYVSLGGKETTADKSVFTNGLRFGGDNTKGLTVINSPRSYTRGKTTEDHNAVGSTVTVIFDFSRVRLDDGRDFKHGGLGTDELTVDLHTIVLTAKADSPGGGGFKAKDTNHYRPPKVAEDTKSLTGLALPRDVYLVDDKGARISGGITPPEVGRELFGEHWPEIVDELTEQVDLAWVYTHLNELTTNRFIDLPFDSVPGGVRIRGIIKSLTHERNTDQTEFNLGSHQTDTVAQLDVKGRNSVLSFSWLQKPFGSSPLTGGLGFSLAGARDGSRQHTDISRTGIAVKSKKEGADYKFALTLEFSYYRPDPEKPANTIAPTTRDGHVELGGEVVYPAALSQKVPDKKDAVWTPTSGLVSKPAPVPGKDGGGKPEESKAAWIPPKVPEGQEHLFEHTGLPHGSVVFDVIGKDTAIDESPLSAVLDAKGSHVLGGKNWEKNKSVGHTAFGKDSLEHWLPSMTRGGMLRGAKLPTVFRGGSARPRATARLTKLEFVESWDSAEAQYTNEHGTGDAWRLNNTVTTNKNGAGGGLISFDQSDSLNPSIGLSHNIRSRSGIRVGERYTSVNNIKISEKMALFKAEAEVSVSILTEKAPKDPTLLAARPQDVATVEFLVLVPKSALTDRPPNLPPKQATTPVQVIRESRLRSSDAVTAITGNTILPSLETVLRRDGLAGHELTTTLDHFGGLFDETSLKPRLNGLTQDSTWGEVYMSGEYTTEVVITKVDPRADSFALVDKVTAEYETGGSSLTSEGVQHDVTKRLITTYSAAVKSTHVAATVAHDRSSDESSGQAQDEIAEVTGKGKFKTDANRYDAGFDVVMKVTTWKNNKGFTRNPHTGLLSYKTVHEDVRAGLEGRVVVPTWDLPGKVPDPAKARHVPRIDQDKVLATSDAVLDVWSPRGKGMAPIIEGYHDDGVNAFGSEEKWAGAVRELLGMTNLEQLKQKIPEMMHNQPWALTLKDGTRFEFTASIESSEWVENAKESETNVGVSHSKAQVDSTGSDGEFNGADGNHSTSIQLTGITDVSGLAPIYGEVGIGGVRTVAHLETDIVTKTETVGASMKTKDATDEKAGTAGASVYDSKSILHLKIIRPKGTDHVFVPAKHGGSKDVATRHPAKTTISKAEFGIRYMVENKDTAPKQDTKTEADADAQPKPAPEPFVTVKIPPPGTWQRPGPDWVFQGTAGSGDILNLVEHLGREVYGKAWTAKLLDGRRREKSVKQTIVHGLLSDPEKLWGKRNVDTGWFWANGAWGRIVGKFDLVGMHFEDTSKKAEDVLNREVVDQRDTTKAKSKLLGVNVGGGVKVDPLPHTTSYGEFSLTFGVSRQGRKQAGSVEGGRNVDTMKIPTGMANFSASYRGSFEFYRGLQDKHPVTGAGIFPMRVSIPLDQVKGELPVPRDSLGKTYFDSEHPNGTIHGAETNKPNAVEDEEPAAKPEEPLAGPLPKPLPKPPSRPLPEPPVVEDEKTEVEAHLRTPDEKTEVEAQHQLPHGKTEVEDEKTEDIPLHELKPPVLTPLPLEIRKPLTLHDLSKNRHPQSLATTKASRVLHKDTTGGKVIGTSRAPWETEGRSNLVLSVHSVIDPARGPLFRFDGDEKLYTAHELIAFVRADPGRFGDIADVDDLILASCRASLPVKSSEPDGPEVSPASLVADALSQYTDTRDVQLWSVDAHVGAVNHDSADLVVTNNEEGVEPTWTSMTGSGAGGSVVAVHPAKIEPPSKSDEAFDTSRVTFMMGDPAEARELQTAMVSQLTSLVVPREVYGANGEDPDRPTAANLTTEDRLRDENLIELVRVENWLGLRDLSGRSGPRASIPVEFHSEDFSYTVEMVNARGVPGVLAWMDPERPFRIIGRHPLTSQNRSGGRTFRHGGWWGFNPDYWENPAIADRQARYDDALPRVVPRAELLRLDVSQFIDFAPPGTPVRALPHAPTDEFVFYAADVPDDRFLGFDREVVSPQAFDALIAANPLRTRLTVRFSDPPRTSRADSGRSTAAAMGGTQAHQWMSAFTGEDMSGEVGKLAKYEWCHLIGDGDNGPSDFANLVIGTNAVNTEQLAMEMALRQHVRSLRSVGYGVRLTVTAFMDPALPVSVNGIVETRPIKARYISYRIDLTSRTDGRARVFPVHRQIMDADRGVITSAEFEYIFRQVQNAMDQAAGELRAHLVQQALLGAVSV